MISSERSPNDAHGQDRVLPGDDTRHTDHRRRHLRRVLLAAVVESSGHLSTHLFRQRRNVPVRAEAERGQVRLGRQDTTRRD